MRNTILFTLFVLGFSAILVISQSESPDEQLAYRMSKSESFREIINAGKRMADHITHLPDSIKNKFRQYKVRLDSIQKNANLTLTQKRDSILQLVKVVIKADTGLIGEAKDMGPVYKNFNKEFPEFMSMSKEERSSVFKKATWILMKHK